MAGVAHSLKAQANKTPAGPFVVGGVLLGFVSSLAFVSLNLLLPTHTLQSMLSPPACHLFLCSWGRLNNFLRNCWQDVAQEQLSSRTSFLIKITQLSCVAASSWFKVITLGQWRSVTSSYPFFFFLNRGEWNLYTHCTWSRVQDHLEEKVLLVPKGRSVCLDYFSSSNHLCLPLHGTVSHSGRWLGVGTSHIIPILPQIAALSFPSTQMNWDMYLLFQNFLQFFEQSPIVFPSCSETADWWSRGCLESTSTPGRANWNMDFTAITSVHVHNKPMTQMLLFFSFYRWENWVTERLITCPNSHS